MGSRPDAVRERAPYRRGMHPDILMELARQRQYDAIAAANAHRAASAAPAPATRPAPRRRPRLTTFLRPWAAPPPCA
jgi:hypothetical protein